MRENTRFSLNDRVAIITGGAGLLGREHALALARAGAHVVIADVVEETAGAVARTVTDQTGRKSIGIGTDVSDKHSVEIMVEQTLRQFGRLDILVNNAALDPKFDREHVGEHGISFEEFSLERWNRSLAVDLTGSFLCAQAVAPSMLSQGKGTIVNISSIYGVVGPDQRLYMGAGCQRPAYKPVTYSVTKSALIGLTRYLATYWAGKNIRVNALTLGGVFNNHEGDFAERYAHRTPLGRMAEKAEYAEALVFLVSDASSYMTGANLVIDGGWTAW